MGGPVLRRDIRAALVTALVVVALAITWTVYVTLQSLQSTSGGNTATQYGDREAGCPRAQHDYRPC